MNECEESVCGPGSRVSYVFLAPQPHSLEAYAAERARIGAFLRSQAPADVELHFDPPTVERIGPVTIYESRRRQTLKDGTTHTAISMSLHASAVQIDAISSSSLPRAAEGNMATFRAMIVIWMAMQAEKK
jgi:hypothetical protein